MQNKDSKWVFVVYFCLRHRNPYVEHGHGISDRSKGDGAMATRSRDLVVGSRVTVTGKKGVVSSVNVPNMPFRFR